MADLARLGVVVDPSGAAAGVAAVNRSLGSMFSKAKRGAGAVGGVFTSLRKTLFSLKGVVGTLFTGFVLREVIGQAREFGQAISDLSAITGATGDQLEFLRNKAREFGSTTTLSGKEAAEAFKLIASAKPDLLSNATALAKVTKEAITLSEASGVLLPDAARVLGLSLNQFNLAATESTRVINVLAAGSKFGSSEVAKTGQAIEKAGAVAKISGVSFEELNGLIQILAANGIEGSLAGTQIKGVLLKLGQQGDATNPKLVGINKSLAAFTDITDDAGAAAKIFGSENVAAAAILSKSVPKLKDMIKAITDTNIALEQQGIRTDNLNSDIFTLNSAYEDMLIQLGDNNQTTLRNTVQSFTGLVRETTSVLNNFDLVAAAAGTILPLSFNNLASSVKKVTATLKEFFLVSPAEFIFPAAEGSGPTNLDLQLKRIEEERLAVKALIIADNAPKPVVPKTPAEEAFDLAVAAKDQEAVNAAKAISDAAIKERVLTEKEANAAAKEALRLTQSFLTPQEELNASLARFIELSKLKGEEGNFLISQGTLAQAQAQAQAQFKEAQAAIQATDVPVQSGGFENQIGSKEFTKRLAEAKGLTEASLTPLEEYNVKLERYGELLNTVGADSKALITQETFDRLVKEADTSLTESNPKIAKQKELVESLGLTFTSAFEDAIVSGKGLRDVLNGILQDLIKLAVRKAITEPLFAGITSGLSSLFGFAHGGSFSVGGSGGTDSQLLAMKVTPGEDVTIRTPAQQRAGVGFGGASSGNGQPSIVISIHAPGADEGTIERVKSIVQTEMIPQAVKAARIGTMNALNRPLHA